MLRSLAVACLLVAAGCGAQDDASAPAVEGGCTANLAEALKGEVNVHLPSWSPDGRRIAFEAVVEDGEGAGGIYAITVADCRLERLGPQGNEVVAAMPDWSSRNLLAFVGTDPATAESGVYTMRPDGSAVRRLTKGVDMFPAWSPDGELVAFVRDAFDEVNAPQVEDRNVWIVKADGTSLRKVTKGPWHGAVGWSPDGKRLVTDEDPAVVEVRLDGTGRRVLVTGELDYPSWSPDGSRLLFGGLALAPGGGGDVERLETPPAFEPEWSPDGNWIAFTDGENEPDLWIVRPDGTGLRQLTRAR